jgi:hypothetical protein
VSERHNGGFISEGPHKMWREEPKFSGEWGCFKTDTGWEYVIKRPEWAFETLVNKENDAITLKMQETVSDLTSKAWAIEDKILLTSVVDILRSRGYTVIEPEETNE